MLGRSCITDMKGFKDPQGRFRPTENKKGVRKSRVKSTIPDGIKLIYKTSRDSPDTKTMVDGISKSILEQPVVIQNEIKTIVIKQKDPSDCFKAITNPNSGEVIFNEKPNQSEGEYEATGNHEFEHLWFKKELENKNPKVEDFIIKGNRIPPFTPDLVQVLNEREEDFINGNFGILPDRRLEYPDEINSVVKEIETRRRLGLETNVFDEETFQNAKKLVEEIHR